MLQRGARRFNKKPRWHKTTPICWSPLFLTPTLLKPSPIPLYVKMYLEQSVLIYFRPTLLPKLKMSANKDSPKRTHYALLPQICIPLLNSPKTYKVNKWLFWILQVPTKSVHWEKTSVRCWWSRMNARRLRHARISKNCKRNISLITANNTSMILLRNRDFLACLARGYACLSQFANAILTLNAGPIWGAHNERQTRSLRKVESRSRAKIGCYQGWERGREATNCPRRGRKESKNRRGETCHWRARAVFIILIDPFSASDNRCSEKKRIEDEKRAEEESKRKKLAEQAEIQRKREADALKRKEEEERLEEE